MKLFVLTATAFLLTACASETVPVAKMSCTELARNIGKATQIRDTATVDSIAGTVDMLATESTADEITGGLESLAGDLTHVAATQELDALNRAFRQNGCS